MCRYMSPERIVNSPYSYMSDIWSLGVVLHECATGKYPFSMQGACIEMAQSILDAQVPDLPSHFSPEFRDFWGHCLRKEPNTRLSAEALLSHPWLLRHQASSYDAARATVCNWIKSLSDEGVNVQSTATTGYSHK